MIPLKSLYLALLAILVFVSLSCETDTKPAQIGQIHGIPDNLKVVGGQAYSLHISPTGSLLDWSDIQWTSSHTGDSFTSPNTATTTYTPAVVTEETDVEIVCTATPAGLSPQTVNINFKIVPSSEQYITVIYPNGDETLYKLAGTTIRWSSTNVQSDVKIEYSTDNFNSVIIELVAETQNTGSWVWYSINVDETTTGRIRITSLDDPSVFDVSNFDFTVLDTPH